MQLSMTGDAGVAPQALTPSVRMSSTDPAFTPLAHRLCLTRDDASQIWPRSREESAGQQESLRQDQPAIPQGGDAPANAKQSAHRQKSVSSRFMMLIAFLLICMCFGMAMFRFKWTWAAALVAIAYTLLMLKLNITDPIDLNL